MPEQRVGWLGGSFNPVHEGHLYLARSAIEQLGLTSVYLVPAATPPHKQTHELASGKDRMELLHIATREDPMLIPHDVELRRAGVSYSLETAVSLLSELPEGASLFALVGSDTLHDLPQWHQIESMTDLVTFCPLARSGVAPEITGLTEALGEAACQRILDHVISRPEHPASSSAIRTAIARGETPQWLAPGVLQAIHNMGIYGIGGGCTPNSDVTSSDSNP